MTGALAWPDGSPAVHIEIKLYERYPGYGGGARLLKHARTDSGGGFQLDGIDFGDATPVLEVHAGPDFAVLRRVPNLATAGIAHLGTIVLEPFQVLQGRFEGSLPGTRHSIQLLDPMNGSTVASSPLSVAGEFRLSGFAPGRYSLRVSSESGNWTNTKRAEIHGSWEATRDAPRQRIILQATGQQLHVAPDLFLAPITGRPVPDRPQPLAGVLLDAAERPLPGLLVTAHPKLHSHFPTESSARCFTDDSGYFEVVSVEFPIDRLLCESAHGRFVIHLEDSDHTRTSGPPQVSVEPSENMRIVLPIDSTSSAPPRADR